MTDADRLATLTPRQREVMALFASGLGHKAIARRLGISVRTVEQHSAAVRRKAGVTSLPGLVLFAVRCGIVTP